MCPVNKFVEYIDEILKGYIIKNGFHYQWKGLYLNLITRIFGLKNQLLISKIFGKTLI